MITNKIKLNVFKYTEDVSTNYNLETNNYNVGTIYNWGENNVEGNYKVRERGSINKSNLEEVIEFVENGIKEQFGRFGIEIEFIDLKEMFLMNGIPSEITFEDSVIEQFKNEGCNFYDNNDNLIATFGDCSGGVAYKTDYKKIVITHRSVKCYFGGGTFSFGLLDLFDNIDKWTEFVESVNVKS